MTTRFENASAQPDPILSPPKRLRRFRVEGLFGHYVHEIQFDQHTGITFIYGPNGIGKTTILGIIHRLFNRPLISLLRLPFQSLLVETHDGASLSIVRRQITSKDPASPRRICDELRFTLNGTHSYDIDDDWADRALNLNIVSEFFPEFVRVDYEEWIDRDTGVRFDLNDLWENVGDFMTDNTADEMHSIPEWLQLFRGSLPVEFLSTDRLYTRPIRPNQGRPTWHYNRDVINRTVTQYSLDLANRIRNVLSSYGEQSQSLERTFLRRLMQRSSDPTMSFSQLQALWRENEQKKARLEEIGVLLQEEEQLDPDTIANFEESNRVFLELYALDVKDKLTVFDSVYPILNELVAILRNLFRTKRVKVGQNGLQLTFNKSPLDIRKLSSGEQHVIVLTYNLLFIAPPRSFVMVDEPEISLHVAWQTDLLTAFQNIASLTQSQFLIATHSPQIINERWDLAVELEESRK